MFVNGMHWDAHALLELPINTWLIDPRFHKVAIVSHHNQPFIVSDCCWWRTGKFIQTFQKFSTPLFRFAKDTKVMDVESQPIQKVTEQQILEHPILEQKPKKCLGSLCNLHVSPIFYKFQ